MPSQRPASSLGTIEVPSAQFDEKNAPVANPISTPPTNMTGMVRDVTIRADRMKAALNIAGKHARHDAIAAYAKENGLQYLDLNTAGSGLGFDWKTDTSDGGTHLNTSGARKVTNYLGAYLQKNYALKDRRGETDWTLWQKNYQQYCRDYSAV